MVAAIAMTGCGGPEELQLEAVSVELRPSRDDVSVGAATLILRCLQRPRGTDQISECESFAVDGPWVDSELAYVELERVEENTFALPALNIGFESTRGGYLCVALKLSLAEVSNMCDSDFYVRRDDRYAIVSYCSVDEHPSWAEPHIFDFNRVSTVEELAGALENGFEVDLEEGPLPVPIDPEDPNSSCTTNP